MNSKLAKASLAGVAAIAVAAGGTTFAAWSDFAEITGNESGAGVLTLDVAAKDGSPTFTIDDLVPGTGSEQNIYLVNRDNDAVPLAALTMKFQNVVNNENGCSSNSEAVAEGATEDEAAADDYSNATCDSATDTGEFGDEAKAQILATAPGAVSSAADCPASGGYGSLSPSTHNRTLNQILNQQSSNGTPIAGGAYSLGSLAPGQGVCVRMAVSLPITATNASQGDSVSYDIRFDLAQ